MVNFVVVAASLADPGNGPDLFKIRDDVLNGPFSDANPVGTIAQTDIRIFVKEHENMRMVRQKGPRWGHFFLSKGYTHNGNRMSVGGRGVNLRHEFDFVN